MITFGVPCYYGAEFLDKCLFSLHHSKSREDEVLVHDDGTPNNSIKNVAKKYNATFIKTEENNGIVYGWNSIVQNARHDLICLIDSDVAVLRSFRDKLVEDIDEYCGVLGYESTQVSFDYFMDLTEDRLNQDRKPKIIRKIPTTQLAGYCFSFSRKDYESVGGFDENYKINLGDADFCCMLATQLDKISYRINYPKVFHMEHSTLYKISENERSIILQREMSHFETKWKMNPETISLQLTRKCLGW